MESGEVISVFDAQPSIIGLLSAEREIASVAAWVETMDARLREGIGLFNGGRFFESHEVLEEIYRETENANKPFLEGLIQLAAAFRIFTDFGEIQGPVRMVRQALIRFENYQPAYLEVRVAELSAALETWAKATEAGGAASTSVPKIQLHPFGFFP